MDTPFESVNENGVAVDVSMSVREVTTNRRDAWHPLPLRCAGICAALLIMCTKAHALEYCVSSDALLQAALAVATTQQVPYTVKVAQGSYHLNDSDIAFPTPVTLLGGYTADCASRSVNPSNTTIDMNGKDLRWHQDAGSPTALISIDGISFMNAAEFALATGHFHGVSANDEGSIRFSRSRLSGAPPSSGGDSNYELYTYGGPIVMENVVLEHLPGAYNGCAMSISGGEDDQQITLDAVTADLVGSSKLCFGAGSGYVVSIYNSVIWSSDGSPASIDASGEDMSFHITNSIYRNTTGTAQFNIVGALHTDPKWVAPANGNYHLQGSSPAVDTGTPVVLSGLPDTDIEGNARWVGSAPDRGAYESAFTNATVFTVTTTADTSGAGTLRTAISQANAAINPAKIKFAIPGGCPQVVALTSALPKIIAPMIIDGTTQPGSTKNSDPYVFNANICVLVKPASGTLSYGFSVAQGADASALTLRGFGLGGFGQPVSLLGGSGHVIAGNQFGGNIGGVTLPGAGLSAITLGVNANGSLIIGGSSLVDRNVIGGAAIGSGINVQSEVVSSPDKCQIVNNLIGLAPNGNSSSANFTGIKVSGSGCSVTDNVIAGNENDGVLISGNDNVIQNNAIGLNSAGVGFFGTGSGIRITGNGNVVGVAAASGFAGNTIRFMATGVTVVGGVNNSVRGNAIYDNGVGLASGSGMDIDLGDDGPSANDLNDMDMGSNGGQNFPLIDRLESTGTTMNLDAHLNSVPGNYRIEAYYSARCDNGVGQSAGRGHAEMRIGSKSLVMSEATNTASFTLSIAPPAGSSHGFVSLTATNELGNTSEMGSCFSIDRIFANGFD